MRAVVEFVVANMKSDPNAVFAGSVPYLKLAGIVLGGWQMARALLVAARKARRRSAFYGAKIATAQFFAEHVLPLASALEASIVSAKGGEGMLALIGRSVLTTAVEPRVRKRQTAPEGAVSSCRCLRDGKPRDRLRRVVKP